MDTDSINFISSFKTLKIHILKEKKILKVELNRPKQLNAINDVMFDEFKKLFSNIPLILKSNDVRVIILCGNGKAFCSGLDLRSKIAEGIVDATNKELDTGRKAFQIYNLVTYLQESLTAIENCPLPVISAIQGYCLGGALSIITCTDYRIATKNSKFSIKEIDIGLTADIGVLQRLSKLIGKEGVVRRLSYTGEIINADDAYRYGIIEELVEDEKELMDSAMKLAEKMAQKSPLVLWGIKRTLNFARDNSLKSSLEMVATLNSALIQSDDITESIKAVLSKSNVMYPKL